MNIEHVFPWKRNKSDIGILSDLNFISKNQIEFGENSFISSEAQVDTKELKMGSNSFIASHSMIRGNIILGSNCSINAYANIAGAVAIGDGVRIASFVSIMGFNHGHSDPHVPIYKQPHIFKGIKINDDVWIGANAIILDGVTIGAHSIIGAGAVVTKSFPPYCVLGGNPAKIIKMRNEITENLQSKISNFNLAYSNDWHEIIKQNRWQHDKQWVYFEGANRQVNKRALCDAIEIASSFAALPPDENRENLISKLQSMQDSESGLCISKKEKAEDLNQYLEIGYYPTMAAFYALLCLNEKPLFPVNFLKICTEEKSIRQFEKLPWSTKAWGAGSGVDEFMTLCYFQNKFFEDKIEVEVLFAWLDKKAKPHTGLWGDDTIEQGWLQPINGFYRLTRGSYAQFKKPLPYPVQAINTIMTHIQNFEFLKGKNFTACNILDVVHPLWLCAKQTDHRKDEIRLFMEKILEVILTNYIPKKGFGFTPQDQPSLKGTEMWASIVYIACDYLGLEKLLSYQPKGIHLLSASK
jgi:acetyltransferase-like isoleucine patch superfamily enzyme